MPVAFTVARDGDDELHTPPPVASVNAIVKPGHTAPAPAIVSGDPAIVALTVTTTVEEQPGILGWAALSR